MHRKKQLILAHQHQLETVLEPAGTVVVQNEDVKSPSDPEVAAAPLMEQQVIPSAALQLTSGATDMEVSPATSAELGIIIPLTYAGGGGEVFPCFSIPRGEVFPSTSAAGWRVTPSTATSGELFSSSSTRDGGFPFPSRGRRVIPCTATSGDKFPSTSTAARRRAIPCTATSEDAFPPSASRRRIVTCTATSEDAFPSTSTDGGEVPCASPEEASFDLPNNEEKVVEELPQNYEELDRQLALRLHSEDLNLRRGRRRLDLQRATFCQKKHEQAIIKSLVVILKVPKEDWTQAQRDKLREYPELAKVAKNRLKKKLLALERVREIEDTEDVMNRKCRLMARLIRNAKNVVVYTGAGISTSASIPDYRGPNGIWTMLQKGQNVSTQNQVLLHTANPTPTHMALFKLQQLGIVKHIVSQNCDGLHLRSGIPREFLSEVHGNMHVEVCCLCRREYVRLFDVTEHTRRREHRTGRNCYYCGATLKDTVVHFGEKGSVQWPLNWPGAEVCASKADLVLCLGSSLKVLRRYPWLWNMDKPSPDRPTLCIVNLQWTPKDPLARVKVNGRCDRVMEKVMELLKISIPEYERHEDALFKIATPLHPAEYKSRSTVELAFPDGYERPGPSKDWDNYIPFEPVNVAPPICIDEAAAKFRKVSGTGWLGNAWGVRPKSRKTKRARRMKAPSAAAGAGPHA